METAVALDKEMNESLGQIFDHLTELTAAVARVETKVSAIEEYQAKQNGRVFFLGDEIVAIKKEMATNKAVEKANQKWMHVIWLVIGGGVTFLVKDIVMKLIQ